MAKVQVPEGFRIERDTEREHRTIGGAQIDFHLFAREEAERPLTTATAHHSSFYGGWVVRPGSMRSPIPADEARARGLALMMAADECDRRNG